MDRTSGSARGTDGSAVVQRSDELFKNSYIAAGKLFEASHGGGWRDDCDTGPQAMQRRLAVSIQRFRETTPMLAPCSHKFVMMSIIAATSGCAVASTDSPEHTDSVSQAIVGGGDASEDAAVVALIEEDRHYCSGTLIAPRVVITAGHCVRHATPSFVVAGTEKFAVTGSEEHPNFDLANLNHDLGLVFLASDASAAPARLSDGPRAGDRIRVVGFGNASPSVVDREPTRRTGFQKVDQVYDSKFRGRPDPSSPCSGDSGGAVFNERNALVGVISGGDHKCNDYALATRVDAHHSFIERAVPTEGAASEDGCSVGRGTSRGAWNVCGPLATAALLTVALGRRRRRR